MDLWRQQRGGHGPSAAASSSTPVASWQQGGGTPGSLRPAWGCKLLEMTDEILLNIAGCLPAAKDLHSLALTNTRFTKKCIVDRAMSSAAAAAAPEMLSIVEVVDLAARLWLARSNAADRAWAPRRCRGTWFGLMHAADALRLPAFDRAHPSIALSASGAVAARSDNGEWGHVDRRTAASSVVMRSGRHFAQFPVLRGDETYFGVIRPSWDVESSANAEAQDGHCFISAHNGHCVNNTSNPPMLAIEHTQHATAREL